VGLPHPYVRVHPTIRKRKEGAARAAPSEASGCDALMTLGESVVGHVGLTHAAEQIGLEPRALADHGVDRLQVQQLLVADEACAFAQCPVEGEADGLDAASGSPGVGDLVAALVLGGRCQDHVGHAGMGFIERLPEQFMVSPVGAAGEDHHRASGRMIPPGAWRLGRRGSRGRRSGWRSGPMRRGCP